MPLRDSFNNLVNRAEAKYKEYSSSKPQHGAQGYPGQQYGQQPQYGQPPAAYPQQQGYVQQPQYYGAPPPPVPFASKPQSGPSGSWPQPYGDVYWRGIQSDRSVADLYDYKTGQHGWGNEELQNYTDKPGNSFYSAEGQLILQAHVNSAAPTQEEKYTSARLVSKQRLSRTEGYLHARLTTPCAVGIWPAFWLLPFEPLTWPVDGEIDIAEDWNNLRTNHSCLHWGYYGTAEDANKHQVVDTPIPYADHPNGRQYGFAWRTDPSGANGKLVWYVDGQAVMRCWKPPGTRPIQDFTVLLNIAMGGTVCQKQPPLDGVYTTVVHELFMSSMPPGGWDMFEAEWARTNSGPAAPR